MRSIAVLAVSRARSFWPSLVGRLVFTVRPNSTSRGWVPRQSAGLSATFLRHGLLMRATENRSENSMSGERIAQRFSAAKIWIVFPSPRALGPVGGKAQPILLIQLGDRPLGLLAVSAFLRNLSASVSVMATGIMRRSEIGSAGKRRPQPSGVERWGRKFLLPCAVWQAHTPKTPSPARRSYRSLLE